MTYDFITYETIDDGTIAIVSLDRPRQRNAQNRGLLIELGEAMDRAERDDAVRVVILRAEGTVFSAGHDMGSSASLKERLPGPDQHPSFQERGGTRDVVEQTAIQEWHYFFTNTRRWRDLRKITIASVQGNVYAAGLMLAWACDLIVADETAVFADVVGTRLGMCGVEYFAHPWEFGARKAKELLLTGDAIDAEEAYRLGMVSKIFPAERLQDDTIAFARRIAAVPTMAALLVKESVNQAQDNQGFYNSLQAAFTMHQLNHAHWATISDTIVQTEATGGIGWQTAPPVRTASKTEP